MNLQFTILGQINDEIFANLTNFILSQKKTVSSLTINISSTGGNVAPGISIYNFLKKLPFPVHTHNLGEVSSAAILPYLSGKVRTAESISKFMIHPLTIGINGELPYHRVQEILHGIEIDIKNFETVICQETNSLNTKHDVEKLLKSDSLVLDPKAAYECGIVTEI